MNAKQWLVCGLLITVLTHDVAEGLSHFVFAKKLIDIQKPVVKAKIKAAHETKELLHEKVADAAVTGLAAAALVKKKALAVAAAPVVLAKVLKAKLAAKLLAKKLKKFKGKLPHPVAAPHPPPVNFFLRPQFAQLAPVLPVAPLAPVEEVVEEVVVPEPQEFTYVENGSVPVPRGFVENALQSLGNAVPILHPITDRMSRPFAYIRNALTPAVLPPPTEVVAPAAPPPPQPLFHFLPQLPPHLIPQIPQYTHVETSVPTGEVGVVGVEHEVYHEDAPLPVLPPVEQEVHVEVPHETYGVPQSLPHNQSFDAQHFRPITSYGAPVERS